MSVFIAQLFPRDKVKDIKGASQAGINFCHSFIEATDPDIVYAYQLNSEQKKLTFDFESPKVEYIAVRTLPHKGVFKAMNTVFENFHIVRRILKSKQKNVWFYNMTPQVMLTFSLLKFIFRKKCFVVVADFTPGVFRNRVALKLLKRSDGIISLTPELKTLVGNSAPVTVKAGIINTAIKPGERRPVNKTSFLFSGSLGQYTGIELALDVFAELPHITLYVSGRGESEEKVKTYSQQYSNIHYLGFLSFNEYMNILEKVDFVLSLRDTSLGKNLYNFPSKIIEYYIAGKIVISTKEYVTLAEDTYVRCSYTKDDLKDTVQRVAQFPDTEISAMQHRAHEFAGNNFSYESWKEAARGLEK